MRRVNRACLTGVASKWQSAPSRSGGRHEPNGSHRDLIRACGRDLLLRYQVLLEILAKLRAPTSAEPGFSTSL